MENAGDLKGTLFESYAAPAGPGPRCRPTGTSYSSASCQYGSSRGSSGAIGPQGPDGANIEALSLSDGKRKVLIGGGTYGRYLGNAICSTSTRARYSL